MYRELTCARCTRPIDARVAVCMFCGQRRIARQDPSAQATHTPPPVKLPLDAGMPAARVQVPLGVVVAVIAAVVFTIIALRS